MVALSQINVATRNIKAQYTSPQSKSAHRDHDAKFATFWRRLGFGKPVPVFQWTVEDDLAATLAKEIADEIDREFIASMVGWK